MSWKNSWEKCEGSSAAPEFSPWRALELKMNSTEGRIERERDENLRIFSERETNVLGAKGDEKE